MNEDFRDWLAALLDSGARFIVVGAHAMAVHGVPRATGDLGVWTSPAPGNADRVWAALLRFGAPVAAMGVSPEDLTRPDHLWERRCDARISGARGPVAAGRVAIAALVGREAA